MSSKRNKKEKGVENGEDAGPHSSFGGEIKVTGEKRRKYNSNDDEGFAQRR